MEYLPLTRIIHNNNTLCIDNECSFPAMRLSANSKLRDRIAEIYSDIEFYKNKLKAYRYTERTVSDGHLYDLLILCAINKILPLLSSFIKEDAVHPWLYYIALCQFAGKYLHIKILYFQIPESLICHTIIMIRFHVSVISSIILKQC